MQILSRREFFTIVSAAGLGITATKIAAGRSRDWRSLPAQTSLTGDQALADLLAGNKRFAGGTPSAPRREPQHFRSLAGAQNPHSIVIACADSRVAPEILFDAGIGDIFVVSVAGNVVDSAGVVVTGSIEYAVAALNVPLIMVLGHSDCGAVKSAMKQIDAKEPLPGDIDRLVELIKPAVLISKGRAGDPLDNAIRENVIIGVERLKRLDPIVEPAVKAAKVKVVGGVYDLATGKVTLI
jgi:carbonic anhydrase